MRDRNFYTREAVESCVPLFNGKQFFIDHPTATEEGDRPERSVRDLAGYFYDTARGTVKDPVTGESLAACLGSLRFDESEAGQIARAKVATALEYQRRFPNSKSVYAGISINGGGVSEPGMIQGMQVNLVKEIQEAVSADIVTRPARGGRFVSLMQEAERMAAWRTQHARHRASNPVRTEPSGGQGMAEAKGSITRTPVRDTKPTREAVATTEQVMAPATIKDAVAKIQKLLGKLPPDPDGMLALISDLKADTELLAGMLAQSGGMAAPAVATGEAIGPDAMPLDPPALPAEEPVADEDAMAMGGATHSIDDEEAAVMGDTVPVADATAGVVSGEDSEETEESQETDAGAGMGRETAVMAETEMAEAETAMRYACAHCGESNDVLPPKGHKLVNTSESDRAHEDAARVLAQTVARLQREIARKEGRFVEANKDKGNLLQENIRLKAELSGYKRRDAATKMLREAEIPSDVLSVEDLLQLEPASWPVQIKQAKRTITREAAVLNVGGAGPRADGSADVADANVNLAVAAFKESYR